MHESDIIKIEAMIYTIRGPRVIVRRNLARFPDDFMFEMTKEELENWRFQFGTSNSIKMGLRVQPFVFTELGVAMLSSILNSEKAISVNISIMRIFAKLRSFLLLEKEINARMHKIETETKEVFQVVFERLDAVEKTIAPRLPPHRKKIGQK
jgi:ORF6N domain